MAVREGSHKSRNSSCVNKTPVSDESEYITCEIISACGRGIYKVKELGEGKNGLFLARMKGKMYDSVYVRNGMEISVEFFGGKGKVKGEILGLVNNDRRRNKIEEENTIFDDDETSEEIDNYKDSTDRKFSSITINN